jgi:hypothetical protein
MTITKLLKKVSDGNYGWQLFTNRSASSLYLSPGQESLSEIMINAFYMLIGAIPFTPFTVVEGNTYAYDYEAIIGDDPNDTLWSLIGLAPEGFTGTWAVTYNNGIGTMNVTNESLLMDFLVILQSEEFHYILIHQYGITPTSSGGWSASNVSRKVLASNGTQYGFAEITDFTPQPSALLVFTVDTGTTNTFIVPLSQVSGTGQSFGKYNITVDWGDGTQTSQSGTASNGGGITHTYPSPGIYTIGINGSDLTGVGFTTSYFGSNIATNKAKLIAVAGNLNDAAFGINEKYYSSFRFDQCENLEDASGLTLGSTVTLNCCFRMFRGCTKLTAAPLLPATTLAESCYQNMFNGCTSLVVAPSLPATTLAVNCYQHMFDGCTSLVVAPSLPATTLAVDCYQYMFYYCSSLVNAPALPATTLAAESYYYMFSGCTSLSGTLTIGCSTPTATALPSSAMRYMCYLSAAPAAGKGLTTIAGHANFLARLSSTTTVATGGGSVFTNQTALTSPKTYANLLTGWK